MNLETMFPRAKGCKTRKGAEARIAKAMAGLEGEPGFLAVVVKRPDNTYIPVVVLGPTRFSYCHHFVNCGCCATNI